MSTRFTSLNPAICRYTRLNTTAIITGNVSIRDRSFFEHNFSGLKLPGESNEYSCLSISCIGGTGTGQPIELADILIASIAIENNLILVTGNTKHYQKIQALGYPLVIDNWRE